MLEQSEPKLDAQDASHCLIDCSLRYFSFSAAVERTVLIEKPANHFHVDAGAEGCARGIPIVCGHAMIDRVP